MSVHGEAGFSWTLRFLNLENTTGWGRRSGGSCSFCCFICLAPRASLLPQIVTSLSRCPPAARNASSSPCKEKPHWRSSIRSEGRRRWWWAPSWNNGCCCPARSHLLSLTVRKLGTHVGCASLPGGLCSFTLDIPGSVNAFSRLK